MVIVAGYLIAEDIHRHRESWKVGKVKLGNKGIAAWT